MKFLRFLSIALVFTVFAFSGCTETGKVDYNNPAVQSEIAHAESIADRILDAKLDELLAKDKVTDATIQSAPVQNAIAKAETKIVTEHPRMSRATAKKIATEAAKERFSQDK